MDSTEVSVRITEAIIAKSRPRSGFTSEESLAETYVTLFSEILKRVKGVVEAPST